jgi:ABC-type phosphate/phosphonate transport system substrate-binding protein
MLDIQVRRVTAVLVIAFIGALSSFADNQHNSIRIGTIGALASGGKGEAGESSLKEFIKTESQLAAEIVRQKSWQQLADDLANKNLEVGVFQGYQFVWSQKRQPSIKPLVLAVHGPRYPVIYIVVGKSDKATNLEGLKGRAVAVPEGLSYLRLYIDRQAIAAGQPADQYFSKIVSTESSEEALDQAVDGDVAAAVIDRAALDMFKRRKPGRFGMLKELSHSRPVLPTIIAYAEGSLDDTTRQKFQNSLINANKKDRGQSMLTAFKLNGFEAPLADFATVVKETLETFPPPKNNE